MINKKKKGKEKKKKKKTEKKTIMIRKTKQNKKRKTKEREREKKNQHQSSNIINPIFTQITLLTPKEEIEKRRRRISPLGVKTNRDEWRKQEMTG